MTQAIRTIRIATQGPAGPAGLYPQGDWDAGNVPCARSTVLAHNGGVWLALRDTSAEPAVDAPDDWASWLDFSGMISGLVTLGNDGKIPAAQLPAIAITDTFTASSQAAMLALAAQKGDIAIRSDLNKSFVLATDDPTVLANWKELLSPTDAVLSVAGLTGAIGQSALKTALAISAGDVAGLAASATSDTTNAGNITSGTLSNSRLSGVTLAANNLSDLANAATARSNLGLGALALLNLGGGLTSSGGNLSANVTSVAGRTGAVTLSNTDISGLGAMATSTDAANLTGTLAAARLPAFSGGDVTSSAGSASLTIGATKVTSAMLNADVFSTAHTWSATQTHSASVAMGSANPITFNGTNLIADAANSLSLRNSTNAQVVHLYRTYTDASNYERMSIGPGVASSDANAYGIAGKALGTGSGRSLVFERGSASGDAVLSLGGSTIKFQFGQQASLFWDMTASSFRPSADALCDLGSAGQAVRQIFLAASTTGRANINFASGTTPSSPSDGDLWFDGSNLKLRASGVTYTVTKT